jgi:hypothetical protein
MMNQERRAHSRHAASARMTVIDRHSGRSLGRVVDLSADGFMLFSELPLSADSVWECRLLLDEPLAGVQSLELGADCLWSRPGADNQHCWAGFHIIDLADDQAVSLQKLIDNLQA